MGWLSRVIARLTATTTARTQCAGSSSSGGVAAGGQVVCGSYAPSRIPRLLPSLALEFGLRHVAAADHSPEVDTPHATGVLPFLESVADLGTRELLVDRASTLRMRVQKLFEIVAIPDYFAIARLWSHQPDSRRCCYGLFHLFHARVSSCCRRSECSLRIGTCAHRRTDAAGGQHALSSRLISDSTVRNYRPC